MNLTAQQLISALRALDSLADSTGRIAQSLEALMDQVRKEHKEQKRRERDNGRNSD